MIWDESKFKYPNLFNPMRASVVTFHAKVASFLRDFTGRKSFLLIWLGTCFFLLVFYALILAFVQLVSPSFEVGTEHITLASLQRVADGLPPITRPDAWPLSISTFTPFYIFLLWPLLQVTSSDQVMLLAFEGRSLIVIFALLILFVLWVFCRSAFRDCKYISFGVAFYLFYLFAAFPGSVLAFRPDLIAVFWEVVSFLCLWQAIEPIRFLPAPRGLFAHWLNPGKLLDFFNQRPSCWLAVSALSAATAVAAKQNAIGVFVGTSIYLLLRRKLKNLSLYFVVFSCCLLIWAFVYALYLGDSFLLTTLGSMMSDSNVTTLESFVKFAKKLISELGFGFFPLYVPAVLGLYLLGRQHRRATEALVICLAVSFFFATVGQFKTGAWFNYHFTFFALCTLPSAVAISRLIQEVKEGQVLARAFMTLILIGVTLQIFLSGTFPLALVRSSYRDFESMQAIVRRDFPNGNVYANNSEAIYLHDRVMLTPWSEGIVGYTPAYTKYFALLMSRLSSEPFVAAVAAADICPAPAKDYPVRGKTSRLHAKVKGLCIYELTANE